MESFSTTEIILIREELKNKNTLHSYLVLEILTQSCKQKEPLTFYF